MQKSFDNELTAKIKETFVNYEVPYNSAHWDLLKKKQAKKGILFFFPQAAWAKAAIITTFLALSTFMFWRTNYDSNSIKGKTIYLTESNSITAKNNLKTVLKSFNLIQDENSIFLQKNVSQHSKNPLFTQKETNGGTDSNQRNKNFAVVTPNIQDSAKAQANWTSLILADSSKQLIKNVQITDSSKVKKLIIAQQDSFPEFIPEKIKIQNSFGFSVVISPLYNYSKNDPNTIGTGFYGGIASSFALGNFFQIGTGIMFSKQNLQNNTESEYVAAGVNSYGGINSDKQLDIMALDFPINVQFGLTFSRNYSVKITSGFSSLAYLSEKVTQDQVLAVNSDQVDILSGQTYTITNFQHQQVEENTLDKRFYFAKLLNFSIALERKIKTGAIAIEPFIKYPLGSFSSLNKQIGYAGVGIKYRFR